MARQAWVCQTLPATRRRLFQREECRRPEQKQRRMPDETQNHRTWPHGDSKNSMYRLVALVRSIPGSRCVVCPQVARSDSTMACPTKTIGETIDRKNNN